MVGHDGRGDSISLEQRIAALEKFLGIGNSFSGSKSSSKVFKCQIILYHVLLSVHVFCTFQLLVLKIA